MKNIYFPTVLFIILISTSLNAQNVGIGEATPSTKLEIKGDGSDLLNVKDNANDSKLFIDSDGNVGVGIVAPANKFHVVGDNKKAIFEDGASGQAYIELDFSNVGSPQIGMSDKNNDNYWAIGADDADNALKFAGKTSGGIPTINSNNSGDVKMTIQPGGNVGIGTSSPAYKLDVDGAIAYRASGFDQYSVSVSNSNFQELTYGGNSLATDKVYRVVLATTGTGTNTGYVGFVWYNSDNTSWNVRHVSRSGTSSNHPYLFIDGNVVKTRTDHSNNYNISVSISAITSDDDDDPNIAGADYMWQRVGNELSYSDGAIGIGTASPQAQLHTTGSIRFSNYSNGYLQVNANGDVSTVSSIPSGSINEDDPTWSGSANTTSSVGRTGNVGIGKTGPTTVLDIEGSIAYPINITRTGNNGDVGIEFHDTDQNSQTGYFTFEHADGSSNGNGASFHLATTEPSLGVIIDGEGGFFANTEVALRSNGNSYLTGGNLGLGTTGPGDRLDVSGNIAFTGGMKSRGPNYTSTWMTFDEHVYGNSTIIGGGGLTVIGAGESAGAVRSNVAASAEDLYMSADGSMQFFTGMQSGWASRVNAMQISSAGDVAIGGGTSSSYKLRVHGKVRSDGINETSDGRLKKNVKSVDKALDKVLALRGVNYEWRTEEFPEKEFSEGVELGVIAQEVEKILPEIVDTDDEGYKSVQYSHIVPVLIEAIKEQQDLINEQQEGMKTLAQQLQNKDVEYQEKLNQKDCKIDDLNQNVNDLRSEVDQIKELLQMSAKK